jgi:hypothetical protein
LHAPSAIANVFTASAFRIFLVLLHLLLEGLSQPFFSIFDRVRHLPPAHIFSICRPDSHLLPLFTQCKILPAILMVALGRQSLQLPSYCTIAHPRKLLMRIATVVVSFVEQSLECRAV